MTNVFEEALIPESVHSAIIDLQLSVMTVSEKPVGGATMNEVIEIAKSIDAEEVSQELAIVRGAVNEALRASDNRSSRTYQSLKGLAKSL